MPTPDGSTLPEYTPGGSLHRPGDRRVANSAEVAVGDLPDAQPHWGHFDTSYDGRVHVTETNDAEAIADIWGVLCDREPLTGAVMMRAQQLFEDILGADAVRALIERSGARLGGQEAQSPGRKALRAIRYAYGHTGV